MAKKQENGFMNYEAWQMKKYGNVVAGIGQTADDDLTGSGLEELNRLADWISSQSQPARLFIIGTPTTRVSRLRRKKWFGKLLYLSRIVRSRQHKKLILFS